MRLRDLGGLIVVDFIDMEESKNRREVEQRLRDALRYDRARVQFSSISKFGLLELSRQRLRPALSEGSHITCPRCNGTGHIRDTESSALQILRMVQEESMKDNTAAVHVQVPVEVTSFLLNEKRTEITKIELKQRVTVLLVPNKHLETPNYKLERLRHDDPRLENLQASYTMIEEPDDEVGITRREKAKPKQEPVIKGMLPGTAGAGTGGARREPEPRRRCAPAAGGPRRWPPPPPTPAAPAGSGFFAWIKKLFGGAEPAPRVRRRRPPAVPTPGSDRSDATAASANAAAAANAANAAASAASAVAAAAAVAVAASAAKAAADAGRSAWTRPPRRARRGDGATRRRRRQARTRRSARAAATGRETARSARTGEPRAARDRGDRWRGERR